MATTIQIVTGFLGSGKTTLVRHLVEAPSESRTAVVVGEYAEDGIDGPMIEASGAYVRQITATGRGSTAKSYLPAVRAMVEEGRFARIIVETSGVTEIAQVAQELASDPLIKAEAVFGPTTVVLDAGSFEKHDQFFAHQLWSQVDVADIIAVNKVDKVPNQSLEDLRARINGRNDEAKVLFVYMGQVHRPTVLSIPYDGFLPRAMRANWSGVLPPEFEAFVYRSTKLCYDRVQIGHKLLNLPGGHIARFKGILRCYDRGHCINGMPGQLDWDNGTYGGDTRIAFIGLNLLAREDEVRTVLDTELARQNDEIRDEARQVARRGRT
jgi:G3E family GTPase